MSIFRINPNHTFGTQVALGIITAALLMGIGVSGYQTGRWLAHQTGTAHTLSRHYTSAPRRV